VPTLEEMLASANGWFFLKEFFFSNTKFAPPGRTELELADGIVLFEDVLIVFQAKAREQPTSDPASEEKWFEKRVSRDAVKQVNDTLAYLRDHDIVLRNDRGDEVALPRGLKGLRIVSLVLYAPGSALPPHLRLRKGRLSTTAGMFVHFLPADGYSRVLSTLFTLPEILDYFGHRCTWALKLGPDADRLYEKALVGHYLAGSDEVPANADARWVDTLVDDTDAFQIVRILQNFRERSLEVMPAEALGTSYYAILGELMKLKTFHAPELEGALSLGVECVLCRGGRASHPHEVRHRLRLRDDSAPTGDRITASASEPHPRSQVRAQSRSLRGDHVSPRRRLPAAGLDVGRRPLDS
jgi:hypothetical protein